MIQLVKGLRMCVLWARRPAVDHRRKMPATGMPQGVNRPSMPTKLRRGYKWRLQGPHDTAACNSSSDPSSGAWPMPPMSKRCKTLLRTHLDKTYATKLPI